MTNILLKVNGASAVASAFGKITSGMVGLPVAIQYDDSWSELTKTAFFRVGSHVRKRDDIQTTTTVPWEILRSHGKRLEIGIEGRNSDGDIVIPTIWASVATILPGVGGDIPAAPDPNEVVTPPGGGGGSDGKDGTTFYPYVSEDGIISWENDGGKENPEPVNLVSAVIAALPVYNGEIENRTNEIAEGVTE